jgi:hypothetical protein
MKNDKILDLTKPLDDIEVSQTNGFRESRSIMLADASEVEQVTTIEEQEIAVSILRDVKGMINAIEKGRKDIGKPVLDLTNRINSAAKDATGQLTGEYERVNRMIGGFQQAEMERVERENKERAERIETERKALEEAQAKEAAAKAEMDRVAAKKVADDLAEIAKIAADKIAAAELTAEQATSKEDKAAAIAQAEKDKAEAKAAKEKLEKEEAERVLQAGIDAEKARQAAQNKFAAEVYTEKAEKAASTGLTAKMVINWEIIDEAKAFAHDKSLFRIEPHKTMMNAAAKSALANGRDIPGVRVWESAATSVRGAK